MLLFEQLADYVLYCAHRAPAYHVFMLQRMGVEAFRRKNDSSDH
jgi:hypothetical protein